MGRWLTNITAFIPILSTANCPNNNYIFSLSASGSPWIVTTTLRLTQPRIQLKPPPLQQPLTPIQQTPITIITPTTTTTTTLSIKSSSTITESNSKPTSQSINTDLLQNLLQPYNYTSLYHINAKLITGFNDNRNIDFYVPNDARNVVLEAIITTHGQVDV